MSLPPPLVQHPSVLPAIVEMAGSVILALTPDHRIIEWNTAAEQLYQTPRATALGMNYIETFIAPEHRVFVAADIVEVLAGKRTMNFEDDSILPDGTRRTLIWNVTRMLDSAGTPIGIVAVGQDITARKEAEERFRLVFEHATDGLLLSENGRVLDCNPEALRILGLREKHELVGRRPAEFSPELQPDGSPSEVKSRALGAETAELGVLRFDWMHRRLDGSDVPVEVHVRHAMLNSRRISVVSWYDLSERARLDRERQELAERLAQASKLEAVGQLAGGIAHDFNNLLTAIRNAVDLARQVIPETHEAHEDLEIAAQVTDRAAALTKQLLALGRHERTSAHPLDLAMLVRETLRLLKPTVPPGIVLEECVGGTPVVVEGDRSEFEQVVMNLVLNAKDAMPEGGTLAVSVRVEGTRAVLSVRDTGMGIPEHVRPRIFDPFYSTKPPGQGSGLGLAVAYGVISKRGGSIDVATAPGAGTTFTVSLPLSAHDMAVATPVAAAGAPGRGTVLLVDDDPLVRSTTRRLLEREGWTVQEASDGLAGVAAFAAAPGRFAVVLSDVRMPLLPGPALVRKLHALDPSVPVVLFSGYDRLEGPDDVLPDHIPLLRKPFRPDELLNLLAQTVATR